MAVLLPSPELMFTDADGMPYAGGLLLSFMPGTTTPKATWSEPTGTALNSNPIVLDAAGRCICYGDGDYRLILHDAAGNLVFDQPSSTIVSAAMMPVVTAPTTADALEAMGVNDLVEAEAAARSAADSTEALTRASGDTSLLTALNAETARAEAAEAALQTAINTINAEITTLKTTTIQHGFGGTASSGYEHVTFATPFTSTPDVTVSFQGTGFAVVSTTVNASTTGFDLWLALPAPGVTGAPGDFYWIAAGPT